MLLIFIFIFCFSLEKWTEQREAKLEKQISTFSWRQPLPYLSRFSLIFLGFYNRNNTQIVSFNQLFAVNPNKKLLIHLPKIASFDT